MAKAPVVTGAGAAATLRDILDHRVVILTGKGGVGKSTSAAAMALVASRMGKRVLVVEVDAKGNVPDFFDTRRVGFKPRRMHQGIYALAMEPKASMREYLSLMLHVPGFSLKPLQGFIEYTSSAIPGLKEILVTGKIWWEAHAEDDDGNPRWDLVLVDGPPTGHVVSQLGAARHLSSLVGTGPIHDQAVRIADLLSDPARTAVVLVTIPEEMPVNETVDLAHRFRDQTDITPAALVVNQLQPDIVPSRIVDDFRGLVKGDGRADFLESHAEAGEAVLAAGRMTLDSLARAERLTRLLERSLKLPTLRFPYVFQRNHGFAFTRSLAKAIQEGWEA